MITIRMMVNLFHRPKSPGLIVVSGDEIVRADRDLLDTVLGRASRAQGDTLEDRLRQAFPYTNGYVFWEVIESEEDG